MPISLRIRGNNTNTYTTGANVAVYVRGILPDFQPVGETWEFTGGALRNRKGGRYRYSVACLPFSVRGASVTNADQDFGDLKRLREVLALYRYLWIYEVSGASRVDENGDPFWSTHGLPVAVVLDGDPTIASDFAGKTTFEFELLARELRMS